MKVLLFFLLCLLESSECFHGAPSLTHNYVCPSFPLCHQELGTAAWKNLPQGNQLNTSSALPRTFDKILELFNIISKNNSSTNTAAEPEVLFIGPGLSSKGRSEVLSLPSFTKTNCTLTAFFGSKTVNSYRGYVGRLSPDGLQLCGGYFDGKSLSSCYLVTSDAKKVSSTPMQSVRNGAAAVEMEGGWWVTGGFNGSSEVSSTELLINNTWFSYVDLPFPVSGHCMVKLNSSHVFLTGGKVPTYTAMSYIYSKTSGFIRQEDMSKERRYHGCTLHEDKVWVAGGRNEYATSEYFSLSTSRWLPGPDLPERATSFGRMITSGGKVTFIDSYRIWQLETSGLDRVDEWTWVKVGETKRSRYRYDVVKMKQKDCEGWYYNPDFE